MNTSNLKRVFIHEIGHFIARELNKECFNIGCGTDSIYIQSHNISGNIDYTGGTKAIKPIEYVDNVEISNPIELMAVVLYGCTLQTLYAHGVYKFQDCFNLKDNANGKHDAMDFVALGKYFSGTQRRKIVEFIESDYLTKLNQDQSHLKKVFDLEPLKFLKSEGDLLNVNLGLLKECMIDFFNEHKTYYRYFIAKLKNIRNNG